MGIEFLYKLTIHFLLNQDMFLPFITEFSNIVVRNSEKKFLRLLGASPKTYHLYKLHYIISTTDKGEKLNQEFIGDGKIIYQEYKRIKSYYDYITSLVTNTSTIKSN